MWPQRRVLLISLILILSLLSICMRKRKIKQQEKEIPRKPKIDILQDSLFLDTVVNRTNLLYIFSLRRAPFWDCDFNGENSISAQGNKISLIGDKRYRNIQSGKNTLGERRKVKSAEDVNNVNSANPVIISCILWLLLSLGKACFEMTNDLKERKKSLGNPDAHRRFSLQHFSSARNERKSLSLASNKLFRRSTIESFQPATSFATNYELMRANEAHRILNMSSSNSPTFGRRCSVPVTLVKQLPRQSSLGGQSVLQRQLSGEGTSSGNVDRSPEGKRRMRMIYRH